MQMSTSLNRSKNSKLISETSLDLLHLEIVRFVQKQYPVQTLIDAGIQPDTALLECEHQVHKKLESMGFHTGHRIMENMLKDQYQPCYTYKSPLNRIVFGDVTKKFGFVITTPYLSTELHFMKVLCKEFWTFVFGKQMDRLQTNNIGMFVLKDEAFKPISRIYFDQANITNVDVLSKYDSEARPFVSHTLGMLRGALQAYGIEATLAFRFEYTPTPNKAIAPSKTTKQPTAKTVIVHYPTAVFTICINSMK